MFIIIGWIDPGGIGAFVIFVAGCSGARVIITVGCIVSNALSKGFTRELFKIGVNGARVAKVDVLFSIGAVVRFSFFGCSIQSRSSKIEL